MKARLPWCALLVPALALVGCTASEEPAAEPAKVPITTSSDEARALYLEGRDLTEKLRAADGREQLRAATALDDGFALAWYGQALSAQSAKEFWDALAKAKARADEVSNGERLMILALDAGARSDPTSQARHLGELTAAYPEDERAWNLLGVYHFGRQEYGEAITAYEKAIALDPDYSPPYNQLGYARRFMGDLEGAEEAFEKYIALIPNDPNPYDSFAELLMKTGRFEESITNYEKALEQDPHFVASFVGIGLNQIYLGDPEKARETFARLGEGARNTGERRAALFRTAESWVFEDETEKALEAVEAMSAISKEEGDKATVAGDLNLMGNILLEAGQADEALVHFDEAIATSDDSDTPEEARAAFRRNSLFNTARVALARGDLDEARSQAEEYARQVAKSAVPFEQRLSHHLLGLVALAEKDDDTAVNELQQANPLDPRVQYLLGRAYEGRGDPDSAREAYRRAAEHNALNFNYAYVRDDAREKLADG
jgi:tetratricopeptide (TPR) repeat protein